MERRLSPCRGLAVSSIKALPVFVRLRAHLVVQPVEHRLIVQREPRATALRSNRRFK